MQAELKQQGWSDMIIEALRYLLASQPQIDERQLLDPGQYAKKLYRYRELPHIMTPWKEEVSEVVEQNVYKVSVAQADLDWAHWLIYNSCRYLCGAELSTVGERS